MKNAKSKLSLFGILVLTLSISQGWLDTSESAFANASSRAPANDEITSTVTAKFTDSKGKVHKKTYKWTGANKEITTRNPVIGSDGRIQSQSQTEIGIEATFCAEGDCGDSHFFSGYDDLTDLQSKIQAYMNDKLEEEILAKKELEEKQGDLAKRERDAEKCKIKIVDKDDKEKDIKLTGRKNIADRLRCQADKIAALEEDDDDDYDIEEKKYRKFRRTMRGDLTKMLFSKDEDVREEAESVLEELDITLDSEYVTDYIAGVYSVQNDYGLFMDDLEILADAEYSGSSWESLQAQRRMMMAQNNYNSGAMFWGRSREEAFGIQDMRRQFLRQLDIALDDPNRLLRDIDRDRSVFDRTIFGDRGVDRYDVAGRGSRVSLGWDRFPQLDFDGRLQRDDRRVRGRDYDRRQRFDRDYDQRDIRRYPTDRADSRFDRNYDYDSRFDRNSRGSRTRTLSRR